MGKAKKKIEKKKKKAAGGAQTSSGKATVAVNRKAGFDYKLKEDIVAGIQLTGTEVKSVRNGQVNLKGAFVRIIKDEAFLFGCHISEYKHGNIHNHKPDRERKLLLHKKEIEWLESEVKLKNLTIVPTKVFFKKNWAKVKLALGEGKKKSDKRTDLKRKDQQREIDQALKRYNG